MNTSPPPESSSRSAAAPTRTTPGTIVIGSTCWAVMTPMIADPQTPRPSCVYYCTLRTPTPAIHHTKVHVKALDARLGALPCQESWFRDHFADAHGHERLSAVVRREVVAWRDHLASSPESPDVQGLGVAPATVNAHLASLSGFTTWVVARDPAALPHGNPCAKVADLPLPPLEPRALSAAQVRSLKNVLDRLERFHQHKGRRRRGESAMHGHSRPFRDRAIVYLLLSTGLRREELVTLDLDQIRTNTPTALRTAKKTKITGVKGKGRTPRHVLVSADARAALADYLARERPTDGIC